MTTHTLAALCCFSFAAWSQTDSSGVSAGGDTLHPAYNIPAFSTSGSSVESGVEQQDVSPLLQSGRDVFSQFAGIQFGAARYHARGYKAENQQLLLNGMPLHNPENGSAPWSSVGGLNDVMRYPETRTGIAASRSGFAGAGGYSLLDTKASSLKKGTRISYANTNRSYGNRVMASYFTGLLKNNWAFAFSASTRQGNAVYIPGTFFHANSFYVSADKKLFDKHLISWCGIYTPTEQGLSAAEPLEAYRLAGNNYYNSLWGYQHGKARNSAISQTRRPILMLTHTYQPNEATRLSNSLLFTFGKSSVSALNWNNSPQPRPDYYYYLPSYYYTKGDMAGGDALSRQWNNDIDTRQVNWDRMIAMNQANLYSLPGQGMNTHETRARYIVEMRMEDIINLSANTVYNRQVKQLHLSMGANGSVYKNHKYKQVADLLGATYWLDYDQFAQNMGTDPLVQQNNLEQPDKKIYTGDKFGYDYFIYTTRAEAWAQAEYNLRRVDVYAAMDLSGCTIHRQSNMANGKFPTTSKGTSPRINFMNYGFKSGLIYKLSGRQFVAANGMLMTRPPETNNLFVSQTVRNNLVPHIASEQLLSGDLSYLVKSPGFKLRLTYYYTQINNQLWLRRYWNEQYNTNVNYFMSGVNENHQGLELGVEKEFLLEHQVQAAFSYGRYVYSNRPTAQAWQDNNSTQIFSERTVYLKNYRLGGSPQLAAGLGYNFRSARRWFAGLYLNYFGSIYVEPNPDRRTAEGVARYLDDETEQVNRIVKQQQLPDYYVLNLSAGKSLRIKKRYTFNINLGINNLLNNRQIITSGYEQLRWDESNIDRFANKYVFMTGATYSLLFNLSF